VRYETEVYSPSASDIEDDTPIGQAFKVLTWVVLGSLMLVWGVVGFVFWLPRLVREMVGFSVALVYANMTGGSLEPAGEGLKEAINFYKRGFEMAYTAVLKPRTGPTPPPGATTARPKIHVDRLFKEALWAVFVWWILLSVLGLISWTPLALVRWVATGAWLETLDGVLVKFWMWLDGLMGTAASG
jgi:hypothetical protein